MVSSILSVLCLCVCAAALDIPFMNQPKRPATALSKKLLEDYNPLDRPLRDHQRSVYVELGITMLSFRFDEEQNQLQMSVWLHQIWRDEHLSWHPMEYGNLTQIRFWPHQIWQPDFWLYNSVDPPKQPIGVGNARSPLVVNSAGHVYAVDPQEWKTQDCAMNRQQMIECTFRLGSWTHDSQQIYPTLRGEPINLDLYAVNPEYRLAHTSVDRKEDFFNCCQQSYVELDFKIHIQKRP